MADLEDFFAKRDKSKKSKKKFDTAEDLAKILDAKAKEKKKLETGKSNYLPEGGRQSPGPGLPVGDDDEWLEAEEKKPDFSNLKIQELVLTSDDDEDPSQEGQVDGEGNKDGPWNKKTKSKGKEDDKEKEDEKEKEDNAKSEDKAEDASENPKEITEDKQPEGGESEDGSKEPEKESGEKKYVPPSMRRKLDEQSSSAPPGCSAAPAQLSSAAAGGAGGGAYVPPSRRGVGLSSSIPTAPIKKKEKGAPTLADEESFPSLS